MFCFKKNKISVSFKLKNYNNVCVKTLTFISNWKNAKSRTYFNKNSKKFFSWNLSFFFMLSLLFLSKQCQVFFFFSTKCPFQNFNVPLLYTKNFPLPIRVEKSIAKMFRQYSYYFKKKLLVILLVYFPFSAFQAKHCTGHWNVSSALISFFAPEEAAFKRTCALEANTEKINGKNSEMNKIHFGFGEMFKWEIFLLVCFIKGYLMLGIYS